ncbi:MAG: hypothetical protein A4E40_00820 [Methanoregulaceae archaeon PtaU1.Bin059]|nr:MAG: hypothetical protein A4E40_00820 [Methanoregulaceae archaeon PtaU1.Bin059]
MLTSCRIVPRPLFTFPVERSTIPRYSAISCTSSGECMQGEVVISTRGIPRRSSEKTSSFTLWAASSSRQIVSMAPPFGRVPFTATRAVRWNPLVFDPSMTSFRMVCTWGIGVMPHIFAIWRQIASASGLRGAGGSSSFSTRHVLS